MPSVAELHEKGAKFYLKASLDGVTDNQTLETEPDDKDSELTDSNKKTPEISFELNPLQARDNVLAAKSIYVEGKLIVFDNISDRVRLDLWAVLESRAPYIFSDVRVDRGEEYNEENKHYLIVRPRKPGASVNKRNAFRVYVAEPCQCQLHEHGGAVPATLLDVSMTGFAVNIKESMVSTAAERRDIISISFMEPSITPAPIKASGICVRKVEKDGIITYGCHCASVSKEYQSYVMLRQKAKVRARND